MMVGTVGLWLKQASNLEVVGNMSKATGEEVVDQCLGPTNPSSRERVRVTVSDSNYRECESICVCPRETAIEFVCNLCLIASGPPSLRSLSPESHTTQGDF